MPGSDDSWYAWWGEIVSFASMIIKKALRFQVPQCDVAVESSSLFYRSLSLILIIVRDDTLIVRDDTLIVRDETMMS